MKVKNRLMFEDFFIILIIIAIIYGVYSFFTGDEETIKKENTIHMSQEKNITNNENSIVQNIEKNITKELNTSANQIKEENIINEINTTNNENSIIQNIEENITKEINTSINEANNTIELEENTTVVLEEILTIKEFQNNLLKDIKISAEARRLQHNFFKNNRGFVRARFTISKDGILDNLEYVNGDEYYLKYIKNEIYSVFPLKIPKNLFDQFPQSFELRIEY